MAEQVYKPGEQAPESGVYQVIHNGHRTDHYVTLFRGDQFPACARCTDRVRFHLDRTAAPIAEDTDFAR